MTVRTEASPPRWAYLPVSDLRHCGGVDAVQPGGLRGAVPGRDVRVVAPAPGERDVRRLRLLNASNARRYKLSLDPAPPGGKPGGCCPSLARLDGVGSPFWPGTLRFDVS
jgi:hypothetical protein